MVEKKFKDLIVVIGSTRVNGPIKPQQPQEWNVYDVDSLLLDPDIIYCLD